MKGHIRQRSPGHWAIVLDLRDPETGKRKRKWHSFKGTKREAQIECARLIGEHKAGKISLAPAKTTVADYLTRWLEHMQTQLSPRGHARYVELMTKNVVPLIGAIPLAKLKPVAISQAYARSLQGGRRNGRGGLSPQTVAYIHRVLRHALGQAVRWELIGRNPTDAVDPPKTERREMRALDTAGVAGVLEAARGTPMHIPILLATMTGLRRGELLSLRWRNLDLDRGLLSVVTSVEQLGTQLREKETKSGKGRIVELSSLLVAEMRQHRARQAESLLRLGIRRSDDHHVILREDGQQVKPQRFTAQFQEFLRRHKFQRVRLHDLRHSHATMLLKAGVPAKVTQERLGHSSIAITMDLYSHVMPGMQRQAADLLDQDMRAALGRMENKKP